MKKYLFLVLLFCSLSCIFFSCKKEPKTTTDDNSPDNGTTILSNDVYAGIKDSTFIYRVMSPAMEISITWDAQNLYGLGYDSLDIDTNGSYDLFITLSVLNQDSIHLLNGGMPNPFPYCRLSSRNGLEIAYYTAAYYVGLGQTNISKYADRLDFNERIDQLAKWQVEIPIGLTMWAENPGGGGTPPFGDRYYAISTYYLAIKMNGNNFGWVEIDATNAKNPKFVSHAIKL